MNQKIDIDNKLHETFFSLFDLVKEYEICNVNPYLKLNFYKRYGKKFNFNGNICTINAYYSTYHDTIFMSCPLFYDNAIITLCHEMVHAEQFYTKKLEVVDHNGRKWFSWNGKKEIRVIDLPNLERTEYANLPWEREAYTNEKDLAKKLLKKYNEKGNTEYAPVL